MIAIAISWGALHKSIYSMIYLNANFMPDCRFGNFQIDDVLNLFFRLNTNLRISSDGYNVFFLKHFHRPGSEKVLVKFKYC